MTIEYPATRRGDVLEERAGVTFPDPYRWLEQNTEEVRGWQRAQAELATGYVRRWAHFEALKRRVARLHSGPTAAPIGCAAGRWFRITECADIAGTCVTVAESASGAGRVIFDPRAESRESPPLVSWVSPSPDGRILALGVCADGSENNTIRLVEVDTRRLLPDAPMQTLMDAWMGGVQWLADSSGFYYTALTGSVQDFRQAIYFHRMGDRPPLEPEQVPMPSGSRDYRAIMLSPCGRWALAVHGMLTPTPVAIRDLTDSQTEWRPFITNVDDRVAGQVVDNRYVAVTNVNAPRGRVVAIALDSATPNDPSSWEEIVPESDAVIRSLSVVGGRLYVRELLDTYARVRIFNSDGSYHSALPLPGKGAIGEMPFPLMNLLVKGGGDSYIFTYSSLTQSWGTYCHRVGDDQVETLAEPKVRLEGCIVGDHWAVSADGTEVPYHTVRLASVDANQPQPTLVYAYGSAGVALNPQYPGAMAAFVEAGGVFVHGHLRGGGELGGDWWRSGVLKHRQNSYADLYAIAADLIDRGATTSGLLGVTGGSAGGLMAGVAVTQRPNLWRVVIPRVPVLDLIGGCREPYLRFVAKSEYGDIDDPNEVRRIAGFSPYYLVREATAYPAVYISAGDTDPRCPSWHARKFAAQLQAAQTSDAPILLHVWENAGHGWATSNDVLIEQFTEWLAFAMQALVMTPSYAA